MHLSPKNITLSWHQGGLIRPHSSRFCARHSARQTTAFTDSATSRAQGVPEQAGIGPGQQQGGNQIPLQFPIKAGSRRTLSLTFTCSACGEHSTRLVNPHAWNKGTVFVQCHSCETWHKLRDNLDLVKEYHFVQDTRFVPPSRTHVTDLDQPDTGIDF